MRCRNVLPPKRPHDGNRRRGLGSLTLKALEPKCFHILSGLQEFIEIPRAVEHPQYVHAVR